MAPSFIRYLGMAVLLTLGATQALAGKNKTAARRAAEAFIAAHPEGSKDDVLLEGHVDGHHVRWFHTALHVTSTTPHASVKRNFSVTGSLPYRLERRGRMDATSVTRDDGSKFGSWSKEASYEKGPYGLGAANASTQHDRRTGDTVRRTAQVPGNAGITSWQKRNGDVVFLDGANEPRHEVTEVKNDVIVRDAEGKVVHRVRYRGKPSGPVIEVPAAEVQSQTFDYVASSARKSKSR
jgi:hypothetical protein